MVTNTAFQADINRSFQDNVARRYRGLPKRIVDLAIVFVVFPIVTPICVILTALLLFEKGPLFFGHERIGRKGKVFKCWKFRTMTVDAKERLADLLERDPDARAEWESTRKLKNDPRITKLGQLLRRTSLDELPQLWNVFCGEMSIVGPRPVVAEELTLYGSNRRAYLALRPGVTGLWQVSGRNEVSYEKRVQLDRSYFYNVSLWRDLLILLKTPVVMLRGKGF